MVLSRLRSQSQYDRPLARESVPVVIAHRKKFIKRFSQTQKKWKVNLKTGEIVPYTSSEDGSVSHGNYHGRTTSKQCHAHTSHWNWRLSTQIKRATVRQYGATGDKVNERVLDEETIKQLVTREGIKEERMKTHLQWKGYQKCEVHVGSIIERNAETDAIPQELWEIDYLQSCRRKDSLPISMETSPVNVVT